MRRRELREPARPRRRAARAGRARRARTRKPLRKPSFGARGRARAAPPRRTTSPNPSATEPPTTASFRSTIAPTDASARPTSMPVRSMIACGARCGGRPVSSSIAGPLQYASRQPTPPHAHGRPSGSTTTWPMWPALPSRPCSSRPPADDAAADAGADHDADEVVDAHGRAAPRLAERERLRVVVDHRRQPVSSLHRRRAARKPRHDGMCSGDTVAPSPAPSGRRSRRRTRPAGTGDAATHALDEPGAAPATRRAAGWRRGRGRAPRRARRRCRRRASCRRCRSRGTGRAPVSTVPRSVTDCRGPASDDAVYPARP